MEMRRINYGNTSRTAAGIPFIEWNNFSFCPVGVARMGRKVVANSVRPEEIFAFSTSTRSLMRAPSSVTSKGKGQIRVDTKDIFPRICPRALPASYSSFAGYLEN